MPRIAVIAAVEVSGPGIANGNELPRPMTAASTANVMKVVAMAVGEEWRQRTGEDQQRIGKAEGDGQHGSGAAAENVIERAPYPWT
jgi:hypothetical protein